MALTLQKQTVNIALDQGCTFEKVITAQNSASSGSSGNDGASGASGSTGGNYGTASSGAAGNSIINGNHSSVTIINNGTIGGAYT